MNGLFAAAAEAQRFLDAQGFPNCFIGGLAVLRWGEPRQTTDLDLCVLTGWEGTSAAADALLARYEPRVPDAKAFAMRHRVLLLRERGGRTPFDISLGALPFEEEMISRATSFELAPGVVLRTCGAEDLIISKCVAGRPIDQKDVAGILDRNGSKLDVERIREWLQLFQGGLEEQRPLDAFEEMLTEAKCRRQ